MIMLRLPGNVKEVFEGRLRAAFPLTAEKVLARTREMRGGKLNDPRFGSRMRGEGEYAETIERLFTTTAKRLGLLRDERMEGRERGEEGDGNGEREKKGRAAKRDGSGQAEKGVESGLELKPEACSLKPGSQLRLFE
jgi:DNA repair photolyase